MTDDNRPAPGLAPHLVCDGAADAIEFYKRAFGAADMVWGDRYRQIENPFGHRWAIASPLRKMSVDEIKLAAAKAMPDNAKEA